MVLNVRGLLFGIGIMGAVCIGTWQPVFAVLEGSQREQLEFLDYSEHMIKNILHATPGRDVFNREKRSFVRGVKEHNSPRIYEPDVYTWELAMSKHRKKLAEMAPSVSLLAPNISPVPMAPPSMLPTSPMPNSYGQQPTSPMPVNAQETMNNMIYRARERGLHPNQESRINEVKNKLIEHMNSMNSENSNIPALLPALSNMPKGKKGDSCDVHF